MNINEYNLLKEQSYQIENENLNDPISLSQIKLFTFQTLSIGIIIIQSANISIS